jgi:hypothetical protein
LRTFDVANTFRVGGSWLIDTDGEKLDVPEVVVRSRPKMKTNTAANTPLSIDSFTSAEAGA